MSEQGIALVEAADRYERLCDDYWRLDPTDRPRLRETTRAKNTARDALACAALAFVRSQRNAL